MPNPEWYVVQSKPNKELTVCAQLARAMEPENYFFPRVRTHRGIRGLFPSYLFVKSDLKNVMNYSAVKYTRGVLRVVGSKDEGPIPVDGEAVVLIKKRLSRDGLIDQSRVFPSGTPVRVRKGPLKDLIGILERPVAEPGRVQVLFKLLKYPLKAVMRFEDLEVA